MFGYMHGDFSIVNPASGLTVSSLEAIQENGLNSEGFQSVAYSTTNGNIRIATANNGKVTAVKTYRHFLNTDLDNMDCYRDTNGDTYNVYQLLQTNNAVFLLKEALHLKTVLLRCEDA